MTINVEKISDIPIGIEWDINRYDKYKMGFYIVNGMLYFINKEISLALFICNESEIPSMNTNTDNNTDNNITQELLLNVLSVALHKTKIT